MTSSSNNEDQHAPSENRRKRLKEMEAQSSVSKQLLNVLDSYPIEKYYTMADRLFTAFQMALDERRLDDAYVFGLRFATFSIEGLPKHGQYQQNRMQRVKNKRQVDQVLQRLDLVATRMDAEEKLLARKRREVQEARRRKEEALKQEEERKKHDAISKQQRHAAILRQQRDELLQQQKSQRVGEEQPKKKESKEEIEKRAHEKLRLLNMKSKPQQQPQSNIAQPKAQKKERAPLAPQQSTAAPTKRNSKSKLVQASVDGSKKGPVEHPKTRGATGNSKPPSAVTSTKDDLVSFPQVPTTKPKLQKTPSKQKANGNQQETKPKISAAATKDKKKKSETFQATVFSSEQPKKESNRSVAATIKGGSATVSTGQQASTTVPTGDEEKASSSKSWWDTSASAAQSSQKPWWQRDAANTSSTATTGNDAAPTSTTVSAISGDPANNALAVTTGNEASSRESAPVSKPSAAPQKSSKSTLFQKLSPKKSSNNKKIMPSHPQQPAPSSKFFSSEGYEVTMGSTSTLQVVETEPEEEEEEESYRSKLTPAEAKTVRLLEDTIKLQESRLARMEASKDRDILRQEAKRKLNQGDRKGALHCLAKKKRINQTIDVVKNAIFNMETQIMMLESAVESREIGAVMKEASDAMASLQNGVRVSDFTDEMMGDVLASVGQGGMDMDFDEEELLSELREPSEKDLSEFADDPNLLSLPTAPQTEVEQDDPLSKQEMSASRIVASLF